MLLIDIRSTTCNASAAEFILYRLKLHLAGRHHHDCSVFESTESSVDPRVAQQINLARSNCEK